MEKVTYARTGATLDPTYVRRLEFEEGVKIRLAVPADLKPADIDWDNSRLLRPLPYEPWQHQLLAHVRGEVLRTDWERAFPMLRTANAAEETRADEAPADAKDDAREEASPPNPSDSKQRKGYWARRAIAELWPDGVPDEIPNKDLVWRVTQYAKDKKWAVGGPDTILRAAGRK